MKVTVNKVDTANTIISGTLDSELIEKSLNKLAKQASKEVKIDGFRAGKAPVSMVKKLHGEKLKEDAKGEVLRDLLDKGIEEAGIEGGDILGEPTFNKYEETDNGIEVEIEVSVKPVFNLDGYMKLVPSFEKPKVEASEVEEKLEELVETQALFIKIEEDRAIQSGDMSVINFEGFIDGVAFEGGTANDFQLKIGSNQFIDGFEEQIIGMKANEEKEITVTFPSEYQSKDLAGKEAMFKVKLNEIQEKQKGEANDALAQTLLNDEKATLQTLKEKLEEQLEGEKTRTLYQEELKPKLLEALVAKLDAPLPNNIIEQEIDAKINEKAQKMSKEELAKYKENPEKLTALREEVREDAINSVRATFIVDALAKELKVTVGDQEVSQMLFYEAQMSGQDPQELVKYYQENNLLPALKMGMIEDKVFGKMLGLEK